MYTYILNRVFINLGSPQRMVHLYTEVFPTQSKINQARLGTVSQNLLSVFIKPIHDFETPFTRLGTVSQNHVLIFIKPIHDFETPQARLRTASQTPLLVFIKPIHTFEHPGPPRDQGKPFPICLK